MWRGQQPRPCRTVFSGTPKRDNGNPERRRPDGASDPLPPTLSRRAALLPESRARPCVAAEASNVELQRTPRIRACRVVRHRFVARGCPGCAAAPSPNGAAKTSVTDRCQSWGGGPYARATLRARHVPARCPNVRQLAMLRGAGAQSPEPRDALVATGRARRAVASDGVAADRAGAPNRGADVKRCAHGVSPAWIGRTAAKAVADRTWGRLAAAFCRLRPPYGHDTHGCDGTGGRR